MASPNIETLAESATPTAATNHVITLPSGIQANDLILFVIDKGTPATTATFNAHADYTELLDENLASGLAILYRWAAGGETNPTLVTSASIRTATVAYRISGAMNPATQAPEINGTTATGTSTTPDPPAAVMTGGSKDYLVITFFGMAGEQADDDTLVTTFPTNYTLGQAEKTCGVAGTNLGGMIGSAARQLTASAENPGTFTAIDNAAWRAQTVTIHPTNTQTLSGALFTKAPTYFTGEVQLGAAPGSLALPRIDYAQYLRR